ncbi:PREDICTED: uncharacterized protein LOC105992306 [Dipodomys ordii]|uniref:Uncharacterized protein LOC105992306 n=1 Tax=Dipodomys ordii TaxID=10020 RepID=A0A1S3FVK4_DIPOR|nr:PREDICTED: uncharacterized protein LOC105992306 [Dipodomys ordii]
MVVMVVVVMVMMVLTMAVVELDLCWWEAKESVVQMVKLDRKVIRVILEFQASWGPLGILGHQERMDWRELLGLQVFQGCRGKKVLLDPKALREFLESQEKKANRAEKESRGPLESRAKQESRVCQEWTVPEDHLLLFVEVTPSYFFQGFKGHTGDSGPPGPRVTRFLLLVLLEGRQMHGQFDRSHPTSAVVSSIWDVGVAREPSVSFSFNSSARMKRTLGESLGPWAPLARKGHQEKMVMPDLQGYRVPEVPGDPRVTVDHQVPQVTLAVQELQAKKEPKERMGAQDFLASRVPGGHREKQERKEFQAKRGPLGSQESQEPKEKGEILVPKETKEPLVGRDSLETRESQATKATQD